LIPKRRLDSTESVGLEIDLKKLFGTNVSDKGIRSAIADDLIEIIQARTAKGQGVNGRGQVVELPAPYSKEYSESLKFKAFGKKPNKVNMKLTGSMLSSIDLIGEEGSKIVIGIDNEEAPKAHGHMTGANGNLPVRPFLGLTAADLDEVRDKYADKIGDNSKITFKDLKERNDLVKLIKFFSPGPTFRTGFEE
jgi:phage gpG-like protein